jgi:menaquinone-dependent protoporphyrinogen oxidase
MENKILVTYASKYGSTQEVAEVVSAKLRSKRLVVDIQPVRKVRSLTGYNTIILGTALYYGHLHKDASTFLTKNEVALSQSSVVVFSLGPTSLDDNERKDCQVQFDKGLANFSWLIPVATQLFGGRFPEKLFFPDSMIAALPASPMHDLPANDIRDWKAIDAWVDSLIVKLQPGLS